MRAPNTKSAFELRAVAAVLAGALAAATLPARAADAPNALRLTLGDAIARARAASPQLLALQDLSAASSAELDAARAGRLPQLDLRAGYQRLSDIPEFAIVQPGGARQVLFPNIPNNYATGLSLDVPLYTGGAVRSAVEAARKASLAAGLDVAAGKADLDLEVTSAYLRLELARRRSRVLADAIASYDAHLEDTENRQRFGLAAEDERLAVEVQRDRARLQRLTADNDAAISEADLARLLDLAPGTRVETVTPLTPPPAAGKPGARDVEPLVAEALAARPARAAASARADAADAAVGAAAAALKPTVAAEAGYQYARPNRVIVPPSDRWNDNWSVGVSLRFHVYDGGRARASVAAARARADAARRRLDALDRSIRLEVTARARDLDTADAAVRVAAHAVASAKENVRVAHERFRAGLIPSSELLDAETRLLTAGLDESASLVRARLARAQLDRAVGR